MARLGGSASKLIIHLASHIAAFTFALVRPYRAFFTYLIAVIVGAALLSPVFYALAQGAGAHFHHLKPLANYPFSRYVQRSLLFLALLGLYPFLRSVGLASWRQLGLSHPGGSFRHLLAGFLAGLISLGILLILALSFGGRRWDSTHTAAQIARQAGTFALTALVVSCIEEIFFRAGIFGALRRATRWPVALWVSSLFYAALHFLAPSENVSADSWTSGFSALGEMVERGFSSAHLVPAFFSLTCAGLILAMAYHALGTLYFSIGLHAGWIFWLKFYSYLTEKIPGAPLRWWGTGRLIDGWVAFCLLLVMAAAAWFLARRKGPAAPTSPAPSTLQSAPVL